MIKSMDLSMPQGSLTLIIDDTGAYFRVPIACINDPIRYSVDKPMDKMKSKDQPKEVILNVWFNMVPLFFNIGA